MKKYNRCSKCLELTNIQTQADIFRYSNDLFSQEAEGVAELYLTGCSKKTKDYFKIKILEQLKISKSYNGELIKESIKIKIVKSDNGWVIDK